MSDEPTTSEVMRRLDDLMARLERLTLSLEEGYVRKDVQEARELATMMQLRGHEDELHQITARINTMVANRDRERDERDRLRVADRRLFYSLAFSALLGPVIVALIVTHLH
jgi:hypothetical protein